MLEFSFSPVLHKTGPLYPAASIKMGSVQLNSFDRDLTLMDKVLFKYKDVLEISFLIYKVF